MRKFYWLIPVTMLAFGGYAMAQDKPAGEKPAKAEKAPKAEKKGLVGDPADQKCDLGDVKGGETKDCTIKIKNEADKEVKGLACTGKGFKFEPAKADVAGGASTDIKATYTAPKKVGKKDKPIKAEIKCKAVKVPVTGTLKAEEAAAPAAK